MRSVLMGLADLKPYMLAGTLSRHFSAIMQNDTTVGKRAVPPRCQGKW